MQNKGFIRVFSISLTLICIFYLSFTLVGVQYDNKADKYSNGNLALKNQYLDSLSSEKVYLSYTLKQIREKEIGLGLDLKGGMNVILEVDAAQVLRALANTDDPQFNEALSESIKQNRKGSTADFVTLFKQNYDKINPEGKLANIFSITMSDRVKQGDKNEDVINVLRKEVVSAADNSFNVLGTRIDRFGVVSPNIQKLTDQTGRILIELPGITEPDRVRNLLQGSANLEFWKTYNVNELGSFFNELISKSSELAMISQSAAQAVPADSTADVSADSTGNALPNLAIADGENKIVITKNFLQYFAEPYFASGGGSGAIVGSVSKNDTASVNYLLNRYKDVFPSDVRFKWGFKAIDAREIYFQLFALKGDGSKRGPALDGDVVTSARADQSQQGGWEVSMGMNSSGASRWATITGAEVGKAIAIVLDGYVYSAPNVNDRIEGGRSSITGHFTSDEAKDLENVLKSGKMKAGVRIVSEDVVGPSLGQEAINAGFISFVIALIVLFIFTCILYGFTPGMVINSALLLNFFFTMGALAAFHAVLTLPGIAGMILSLAMAVDANVLINERIKEELGNGKNLRKAVDDGYKNAFSAIFDSNLTSIIVGIILAIFGTGAIRGFAITLIIGIAVSFLSAVFLTRMVYEYKLGKNRWLNLKFVTSISKKMENEYHFDFIHNSKKILAIIGIFIAVCFGSFFTLKLNAGIDFTGGRNYVVRFDQPVKTGDVQDALAPYLGESVRVITIGSSDQVRVSTNFRIEDESENIEGELRNLIGEGLKDYIAPGKTVDNYILSSQKVGPSIAEDLLKDASIAMIIALICMGIYILARFNNWAFSVGTTAALAVDAFSVVGFYSLLWKVMPFSMEIDQTFVAAILTVVGYSINDKVVQFDRIREFTQLYPKRGLKALFNDSMNATLTRTINTGLSTILVIICIIFLGGEAVRSFVFAMLIGIVVGTITSLFVATPVAYKLLLKKSDKEAEQAKK
ncbi:MAG: protein translocase subunit SecDF [Dysgonamonadaceae bacterium]|jgi:SecD/SecF fusion protein|nr:protein translocase subunit SecDF [Dysgonamonadaceae bacterium]